MDFLFGAGPRSLKRELLFFALFFVIFAGLGILLHWGAYTIAVGMAAYVAGSVGRAIWWHYHPPTKQPVTRYTNPRYNKGLDE